MKNKKSEPLNEPVQVSRSITVKPAAIYFESLSATSYLSLCNLMSKSKSVLTKSDCTEVFFLDEEIQTGPATDYRESMILFSATKKVGLRVQPGLSFPLPITQQKLGKLLLDFAGGSVDCFGQPIKTN